MAPLWTMPRPETKDGSISHAERAHNFSCKQARFRASASRTETVFRTQPKPQPQLTQSQPQPQPQSPTPNPQLTLCLNCLTLRSRSVVGYGAGPELPPITRATKVFSFTYSSQTPICVVVDWSVGFPYSPLMSVTAEHVTSITAHSHPAWRKNTDPISNPEPRPRPPPRPPPRISCIPYVHRYAHTNARAQMS